MTTLAEISKRGPRLTPEQQAEQKRQRTQARVGLASNVLGLSAGAAATGAALRDKRFANKKAGPVANWVARQGKKIPQPIARATRNVTPKQAAALAGGALALQVANVGGDVVANRVLARSAQPTTPVKKGAGDVLGRIIGTGKVRAGRVDPEDVQGLLGDQGGAMKRPRAAGVSNTGGWAVKPGTRVRFSGDIPGLPANALGTPHPKNPRLGFSTRMGGGLTTKGKVAYIGVPAAAAVGGTGALVARKRKKDKVQKGEEMLDAFISKVDHTSGYGSIEKAYRRYDPEADRQRQLGLAAGAGLAGAALTGSAAARRLTTDVRGANKKPLKGIAVKPKQGRSAALYSLAALGSGAAGLTAYRRGVSERNNPWN